MSSTKNLTSPRIAIICGGHSAEADVSRSSARGVAGALKENFSVVASFELDAELATNLADFAPDVVFPVLHGPPGEDGTLQGFLEILGYPYVGCDVHSSAVAMDKILSKAVFRDAGLPVAAQCIVHKKDGIPEAVAKVSAELGEYVVVKPSGQGSAIGVTLVANANELNEGIKHAFDYGSNTLVEQRIDGREITVGVIDTDKGSEAFPVIEVTTPEDSWYDFEHRYEPGWSEHVMPAKLPDSQTRLLQNIAVRAHQALGCRDLSRADFVVTDDKVYLLEVNTLPGMTPTSLYPDGAAGFGMDFPTLMKHLIDRAMRR